MAGQTGDQGSAVTQFANPLTQHDAQLGPPLGPPVVSLAGVRLRYRKTLALDGVTLDLPAGCMVGLIGPDQKSVV